MHDAAAMKGKGIKLKRINIFVINERQLIILESLFTLLGLYGYLYKKILLKF